MAVILMLTADSLMALSARLACAAADLRFHVTFSEEMGFDAVVVDLDQLDGGHAELAISLSRKGTPTLALATSAQEMAATNIVADVALIKPVESGALVYQLAELLAARKPVQERRQCDAIRNAC
jgi:hypothetical protein